MEKRKAMEWVKALRSGKFKQGKNGLIEFQDNNQIGYCCLGVASASNGFKNDDLCGKGLLTKEMQKKIGLKSQEGNPNIFININTISI